MCGCLPHTASDMVTYATAAVINRRLSLDIEEISLDWNEVEEAKMFMKTNGRYLHLNMPVRTAEELSKKTVFYRTTSCQSKKLVNAPVEEIKEDLSSLRSNIMFIDRASRFRTMEVKFTDESTTKKIRVTEY